MGLGGAGDGPVSAPNETQDHYVTRSTDNTFGAHQASCTCGWTHAGGIGATAARGTTHAMRSHIRAVNAERRKAKVQP